ncbi:PREDICTED: RNA-directed DNA polymerase from mobile element jockey-like [Nicrophorus vespilloides]|uniref:RNA-directed DNA polymerase from mobile element jockey-like n=1 Tax=Nicrophorus vespilloides TaxID=110193 RepID=A0ABM1MZS5_NICVS|nr:PREDICTED: RNA-directed DNA polymerase from mobile element jockey-like [Nicrophorus vespilloides]
MHTGGVFLDVAKAFDKVWHKGLLHKMITSSFPDGLIQLIESYLDHRTFSVKLGDVRSSVRPIRSGVPQGSILSPFLFAIFMADMPKIQAGSSTSVAYYADDTAILVRHTSTDHVTRLLQEALDQIEDWFRLWRIDVNPTKSVAVLFTRKRATPSGLRFKQHIESTRNKACATIKLLYPLMNRRSRLNIPSKLAIYKSIIRSGMTYASPAWGHTARTHLYKLQVIQNKTLRTIYNAPWFIRKVQLHREANIPFLSEYMKKSAEKAFARAEIHSNPLLRAAVDYDPGDYHTHKRPRMAAT